MRTIGAKPAGMAAAFVRPRAVAVYAAVSARALIAIFALVAALAAALVGRRRALAILAALRAVANCNRRPFFLFVFVVRQVRATKKLAGIRDDASKQRARRKRRIFNHRHDARH